MKRNNHMRKLKVLLALALVFSTGSIFAAVRAGKFGASFAFNGAIGGGNTGAGLWNASGAAVPSFSAMPTLGLIWHVADRVAIAPQVGYFSASFKNNNTAGIKEKETTFTGLALALELPIYLINVDALDFYIAPGVGYTPVTTTTKTTTTAGSVSEVNGKDSYMSYYAAFGLQLALHENLHIFFKTTFGYLKGTSNSGATGASDDSLNYVGMQRWAVGAIAYFN